MSTRHVLGRWITVTVAAVGVGAVLGGFQSPTAYAVSSTSMASHGRPSGMLKVTASNVPGGRARIRIVGRGAPKVAVFTGGRVRLPAGSYVVRPLGVKVPNGTRYAMRSGYRIRIRQGRETRLHVSYPNLVSRRVRVVESAAVGSVQVASGTVTVPEAQAGQYRSGQILVSGPTDEAPDGFIRKVVRVSVVGKTVRLQTVPATLQEAVPEGQIDVHLASDGTLTGASVPGVGTLSRLARAQVTTKVDYSANLLAPGSISRGPCSITSKGLQAKGEASVTAGMDFSASWSPISGVKADFQADLTAKARIALEAGISAGCSGQRDTPIVRLARIQVMVGTVPVWLTPFVQGTVSAGIEGGMDATYGLNYTATVSGGFHYENGKLQPRADGSRSFTVEQPDLKDFTGVASVSAGPRFGVLFYDLAGPTVTITANAKLTVAPFDRPWWSLDGGVTAKIGGKFHLLSVDKNFEKEAFSVTRHLADSGTGGPPSSGSAGQTPGPTPSPPPGPAPSPAPSPGGTANTAPTARFTWTRGTGRDVVALDGRSSTDVDGRITTYEWSTGGRVIGTGPALTVSLGAGATVGVTLKVTDDRGGSAAVTHTVSLANRAPVIASMAPPRGVVPSTQPTLSVAATDPDLDALSFNYRVTGPRVDIQSGWVQGNWQVPAHRLDPGTAYSWTATVRDGTAQVSASSSFTVAMLPTAADVVNTPSGAGYWQVDTFGGVRAFGDAKDYGDLPRQGVSVQNIMGMARTPTGLGYWLVGRDGGVFSFGDARFFGSLPGQGVHVNNIVAMAVTKSGAGYWLVGSDGGVFTYGDAPFFGSLGGRPLNAPVKAMGVTPSGAGYWLAAQDGGVFTFGDAPFYGSLANARLNLPVVDIEVTPAGRGYWMAAEDGGVFAFGDATYFGSLADLHLNGHITGMSRTATGLGYWLTGCDGGLFTFGDAVFYGSNPTFQCRGT